MKSQVALAAQQIRKILKEKFPKIKFTVKSSNYSNGDSIHVEYTNGILPELVEKEIKQYQYGTFDGMTDMYEYTNSREDIPQTKYLFVSRKITPDVKAKVKSDIAKSFGLKDENDEQEWYDKFSCWSDQVIWRELSKMTI